MDAKESTDPYVDMTNQEFDEILAGILNEMTGQEILQVPGAYEVFSEEFNNHVLTIWEQSQEELVRQKQEGAS